MNNGGHRRKAFHHPWTLDTFLICNHRSWAAITQPAGSKKTKLSLAQNYINAQSCYVQITVMVGVGHSVKVTATRPCGLQVTYSTCTRHTLKLQSAQSMRLYMHVLYAWTLKVWHALLGLFAVIYSLNLYSTLVNTSVLWLTVVYKTEIWIWLSRWTVMRWFAFQIVCVCRTKSKVLHFQECVCVCVLGGPC